SSRSYVNRYGPSNRFPAGLKWLLIANAVLFVIPVFFRSSVEPLLAPLVLVPVEVVRELHVWQLFSYMFFHAGIGHILWNMLALWLFGIELERLWGTRRFLRFYVLCGIFAGLTVVICAYLFGGVRVPTIGSSGAIYGILAAYALVFPDQTVLFGFLIPMKSKYFVMIIGGIVFLQSYMAASGAGSGIAVTANLGGLVAGYLLIRGRKLRMQIRQPLVSEYRDWKLRRAKRKFEVYLRKQDSNRDRWVH
ncbi:MAG: rhomboid family intramembrane serine protease, partial [Bryobacteraceae bacterium]